MRERRERGRRELSARGRVTPAHHGNKVILQQRRGLEALADRVERANRDVDVAVVETVEHVERPGAARAQIELHARSARRHMTTAA